jgi:hypothetical protein
MLRGFGSDNFPIYFTKLFKIGVVGNENGNFQRKYRGIPSALAETHSNFSV